MIHFLILDETMPDLAAAPEPQIIENPFVTTKAASKQASATENVVEPLKMDNPFVVSADR